MSANVTKGSTLIVFYSEAPEETPSAVMQTCGAITREVFDFPGCHLIYVADPDGNEFALWLEPLEI
jgi:predicted enzyme related to lactoylglutathione lyase